MTIPYRIFDGNWIARTTKCTGAAWSCNVIGNWTEDHIEGAKIGFGKVSGREKYCCYFRPEDGFDFPVSADVSHAFELNFDAAMLVNTSSHTQHIHLMGASNEPNAWDENRSEERRVGKECRSRWSPYH